KCPTRSSNPSRSWSRRSDREREASSPLYCRSSLSSFQIKQKSRHLLMFCSFGPFRKFRRSNCYAVLLKMPPQYPCEFYRSRGVTVYANRLRANIDIYVIDRPTFPLPQLSPHAC